MEQTEEVEIRIAKQADVKDIIALTNECFGVNDSVEYAEKVFQQTENDPNQIYLNAYYQNQLVGHMKVTIIPTIYEDMNTYAILNHVCVKPEIRRQHIATKMLDRAFAICQDRKVKVVELWSSNFREAAHACYKKYGFKVLDAKFFACEVETR